MKTISVLVIATIILVATSDLQAQSILRRLEKAKSSIENATRTSEKRKERQQEKEERTNPASVDKTTFHEQQLEENKTDATGSDKSSDYKPRVGKILFAKGTANPNIEDQSTFVNTLDLSSPSFFNVYLEDPLRAIFLRLNKVGEYGLVPAIITRKYYINDALIAMYTDEVDSDEFKQKAVFSDVLVPSNQDDFYNNEMRIGVLAHVFSSLKPGTYKFRAEYVQTKSTPKPSTTGSAATEFDNEDIVVASGEVNIQIDANTLNAYCKKYGRPKFSKGVIEGQPKLEQQITRVLKDIRNHTPIYMYASDNWKIIRGQFDRILAREARIYYVRTNETGRCELADFVVRQDYEGNGYGAPKFGVNTFPPAFKFVVCQNY